MTRRKLLPFRISFSCLLSLLLLVSLLPRARAHESQSATDLKPGSPIERQIKGGESHIYTIALNSNQYLRVSLEQRGVNLSLSLLSSDGRRIAQADAPHVTYGIETILFVADSAGIYKLDVRSTRRTATALSYQIRVEEMRPSTAEDQDRISAFRAFEEAERFLKQTDTESQNKALERYETAARLYQKTGETFLQAISMKGAAYTLEFLQETEKAYETYLKVLPLLQNSSYRQEPALTLVDMARTRRRVFKHRAALEYYNQALQLFRATANRKREADALLDMAGIYLELGDMQKAIDHSHESALIAHLE
ncbi:MAG TPA: tetratricopeptide repeat protein, partial [Blastocatellia bacterium]